MAISKIILNGVTQMDVTQDTVASSNLLSGYTATKNDGTKVNGSYVPPSAPTLQTKTKTYTPTTSQQTETITADNGYDGLSSVGVTVNAMPTGVFDSPYEVGVEDGISISVSSSGLITVDVDADSTALPVSVNGYFDDESELRVLSTGGKTHQLTTQSGTTITPTESSQTAVASQRFTTGAVTVGAISSTYVGSGITRRSSSDLTASADTVTVPSGYYSAEATKSVPWGTEGTPTATKGTVSNHSVSVTPQVINTEGYIEGGTLRGTAVTVSASELVSGSETKTANGTYDVTNLASLVVALEFSTIYTGSGNPSSSTGTNGDIYLKVVS